MPPIEQQIKVTGAQESKQQLDQVAEGMEGVGEASQETGKRAEGAGDGLAKASDKGNAFAGALSKLTGGLGALSAIKDLVAQIIASFEEALRLQRELAGDSVDLSEQTKAFGAQVSTPDRPVSEEEAIATLSNISKRTGLDLNSARELGIAADIAFSDQGGLFAGQNLETTAEIGSFAQAKAFDASALSSLLGFLKKAGALESPEDAKEAVAKISAAATASEAKNVGKFVDELARGGTALLQQGVGLDDVLEVATQTRSVEVSEELAAQSLNTLLEVAVTGTAKKFTREIEKRATKDGLDAKSLTSAQRIQLTRDIIGDIDTQAEQDEFLSQVPSTAGLRLLKAFGGDNVAANSVVGDAVDSATAADFDAVVAADQDSVIRRRNETQAEINLLKDQTGRPQATIANARDLAEEQLDSDIAQDIVVGVNDRNREAEVEKKVVAILEEQINELRRGGADVSAAEESLESLLGGPSAISLGLNAALRSATGGLFGGEIEGAFNPLTGFDDAKINQVAREIEEARRGSRLNITVVGTQYNDTEAGRHPDEGDDLNE